jgi:hypothetical protein
MQSLLNNPTRQMNTRHRVMNHFTFSGVEPLDIATMSPAHSFVDFNASALKMSRRAARGAYSAVPSDSTVNLLEEIEDIEILSR